MRVKRNSVLRVLLHFLLFFLLMFVLLFIIFLLLVLHLEAKMDNEHWSILYFPKFTSVIRRHSKRLNKVYPVVDGDSDKLSNISVQNILKSGNDFLQGALLIRCCACFKEVVVFPKLVLYFSNKIISPLNKHILWDWLMMGVLHLLHLLQFSWQFQNVFISVHVSVFKEVNTLFSKDLSHSY